MSEAQDNILFARHEELLENEAYLKATLQQHRANAAAIVGGSKGALIQHRITCDTLSHKLAETMRDIEFTERLIAARFSAGKLELKNVKSENLNVEEQ